jgi:hypothetical protein
MATAIFGPRGITVARDLLKAQGQGLDYIYGGSVANSLNYELEWENYGSGLKTTNKMKAVGGGVGNTMIFLYPNNDPIRDIILTDSNTKTKALTLELDRGGVEVPPVDTIKFIREIVITLDEPA